jgi:hypothetical protein
MVRLHRGLIEEVGMAGQVPTADAAQGSRRRRRRGKGERSFGSTRVAPSVVVLCAVFFALAALVLIYALWQFWPPSVPAGARVRPFYHFRFAVWTFFIPREKSLLVIVAVSGALGSMIYVIRSFFQYVGERKLLYSWLLSYFLTPLAGAGLATAVYIVLRAGLISGGGATPDAFGFAAVGILVGLFVQQAAEKLKDVFETLFAEGPKGSDSLGNGAGVPAPGPPGGSIEDLGLVDAGHHEALEPDTSLEATAEANLTKDQASASVLEPDGPGGDARPPIDVLEPEGPSGSASGGGAEVLEQDDSPEATAEGEGGPQAGSEPEHQGDDGGHQP